MVTLGPLAFTAPWVLAALVALPALWWLLRVTPPAPRHVDFPAVRLLLGLRGREETPAHTPWWLLLLRLAIAALAILALAHPVFNPGARLAGSGTVLIVVEDGWASAPDWARRSADIDNILEQADRLGRPVRLLTAAPTANGEPLAVSAPAGGSAIREAVRALAPKPWPLDRGAAAAAIGEADLEAPVQTFWFTDGLRGPAADDEALRRTTERLQRLGPVELVGPVDGDLPLVLDPPRSARGDLTVTARRASPTGVAAAWIRAVGPDGQLLARQQVLFTDGEAAASAAFELPLEVRNRLARLEIEGQSSAAAVALLDDRWRRRPVGVLSGDALESSQPLLSNVYYVERALAPTEEIRRGTIGDLTREPVAVLMLADVGQIVGADRTAIEGWLDQGGVLVRFAGPRLAETVDDLIPVALRGGGRTLGGAMAWAQPARLAPFDSNSPFRGLEIPPDVLVARQVLAEPTLDLAARTWARLTDGTPLVTAERRGRGWLVLFHTTANTEWSNLAISGLFVDMLTRLVELSEGVAGGGTIPEVLPPLSVLDGFGRLVPPPATARPVAGGAIDDVVPGPGTPPGYYGSGGMRRAVNLGNRVSALAPIGGLPQGVVRTFSTGEREIDLKPPLFMAAVLFLLAEMVVSLGLRGLFGRRPHVRPTAGRLATGALLLAAATAGLPDSARADDSFALEATLQTHLAYVLTGNPDVDAMSRAGLAGLTQVLERRTAFEGAPPMGIDLERDEIVYFPLLYWPITPDFPELSDAAAARVDAFTKSGGTILFDTRDQAEVSLIPGVAGNPTAAARRLRRILGRLDSPPFVPVPQEHILTRAFYLIQEFPGRYTGGRVWVERHSGGINDGVSGYVIGAHDWAAAWATDSLGRPVAATIPGGDRQREFAFRFGINLVMYTLTGNYKSDQVHIPAILERLGQ